MPTRIDVQSAIPDARAAVYKKKFEGLIARGKIKNVEIVDSYIVDTRLSIPEIKKVTDLLLNPKMERGGRHPLRSKHKFDWVIDVGFLPGVTDNVGNTTKETIEDGLKKKFMPDEHVYSSRLFYIEGKIPENDVRALAHSLHNPLIQHAAVKPHSQFKKDGGMGETVVRVSLKAGKQVTPVDLEVSDEELVRIGKQGIPDGQGGSRGPLALDLVYMKAIRDYFRSKARTATDVELESIAQTWSEHCKHTIFADPIDELGEGLYKSYIKEATRIIRAKKGKKDFCVSVFTDNAGGIVFDEKTIVTHKVETHNSPSALDPFGGSITGIVGVNRDAMGFGFGAKPIANVYGFCLANPDDTRPLYRDKEMKQQMLLPRRIMDGVIQGVNVGGNCSGIPTAQGFVYFHDRFRGKPLVFVGTVGLIPTKVAGHSSTKKSAKEGDYIVMVGGRVGQDGIHGATFSSEDMNAGSPATAVQIGDPITQKKMSDALVKEARDLGLYTSITDNGAGGISCSVAEMAKECGGCKVELDKVPLKYPGLEPWKIWISESQERMTVSVPKNKWKAFSELMKRRGVEATVIGSFTDSGRCVVMYEDKTIMDVELAFLHNGLPARALETGEEKTDFREPPIQKGQDMNKVLLALLARPNIASYEFISSQYDHEVQASSVIKPLQGRGRVNGDAAVLRPVLDSKKGIVLTAALNPSYSEIDSYAMAASSIDGAIRTAVAAGADPDYLALLDNFCWCSSTEPVRLYQLKKAVKACHDYSIAFDAPLISGKDSMFNDFKGFDEAGKPIKISAPPTLLISAISVIKDASKAISIDFKYPNDLIYLVGDTHEELAGSEYFAYLSDKEGQEYLGNKVPQVNAQKNKKLYRAFKKAVDQGLVVSAVSVGRGGLGIALAKSAVAGKLGTDISLKKIVAQSDAASMSDDLILFSESQGRILVSVDPKNKKKFEALMKGIPCVSIGTITSKSSIVIRGRTGKSLVDVGVGRALIAYKSTFKNY